MIQNKYLIDPFFNFDIADNVKLILLYSIPGYTDIRPNSYYLASNGRIFSTVNNRLTEMSLSYTSGYGFIRLCGETDGVRKSYRMNRLIMLYFNYIPNSENYEVDHIDGNPMNNDLSNLRWVTHTENMQYAIQNGQIKRQFNKEQITEIKRFIYEGKSLTKIAEVFGTSIPMICKIKNGEVYTDIETEYDEKIKNISNFSSKILSSEIVKNIYDFCKENILYMNDDEIAKKFGVSRDTVIKIRSVRFPYTNILSPERVLPIIKPKVKSISDEEILNIYNECKNGASTSDICEKYHKGKDLVTNIKYVRGPYQYLREKYNLEPLPNNNDIRKIPVEIAIKVYHDLQKGMKYKEVMEKYNISESSVTDIKFCRNSFSYLSTSYGFKALN